MSRAVLPVQGEFFIEVAKGNIDNHSLIRRYGKNSAIAATEEDIWTGGGLYSYQTSAQSLEILSGSADDSSAGTGAQTVYVSGLDGNYAEVNETVIMDGTNTVNLSNSYLRVDEMYILTVGSGGTNAGDITLRVSGGGDTQALMVTGENEALSALYTVPSGKTGYLMGSQASSSRDEFARYMVKSKNFGDSVFRLKDNVEGYENINDHRFNIVLMVPEKSDIKMSAISDSVNATVSASFDLLLVSWVP